MPASVEPSRRSERLLPTKPTSEILTAPLIAKERIGSARPAGSVCGRFSASHSPRRGTSSALASMRPAKPGATPVSMLPLAERCERPGPSASKRKVEVPSSETARAPSMPLKVSPPRRMELADSSRPTARPDGTNSFDLTQLPRASESRCMAGGVASAVSNLSRSICCALRFKSTRGLSPKSNSAAPLRSAT